MVAIEVALEITVEPVARDQAEEAPGAEAARLM